MYTIQSKIKTMEKSYKNTQMFTPKVGQILSCWKRLPHAPTQNIQCLLLFAGKCSTWWVFYKAGMECEIHQCWKSYYPFIFRTRAGTAPALRCAVVAARGPGSRARATWAQSRSSGGQLSEAGWRSAGQARGYENWTRKKEMFKEPKAPLKVVPAVSQKVFWPTKAEGLQLYRASPSQLGLAWLHSAHPATFFALKTLPRGRGKEPSESKVKKESKSKPRNLSLQKR